MTDPNLQSGGSFTAKLTGTLEAPDVIANYDQVIAVLYHQTCDYKKLALAYFALDINDPKLSETPTWKALTVIEPAANQFEISVPVTPEDTEGLSFENTTLYISARLRTPDDKELPLQDIELGSLEKSISAGLM